MDFDPELIGCCGFYCGSCPTYRNGKCKGCLEAHGQGDCFTFDCVKEKRFRFCGQCPDFPCDELMVREKATVLDPRWLLWKKGEKEE
jgi:hypothetical protein